MCRSSRPKLCPKATRAPGTFANHRHVQRLAALVDQALSRGTVPLVLGGDHSVAVGTASGVSQVFRRRDQTAGLIWLDAHADMNTPESSPSGNVHGMPLAGILGMGPPELPDCWATTPKSLRTTR